VNGIGNGAELKQSKPAGPGGQRRIIAVCGKGGSGKTTLVSLMAGVLLEAGRRALLIDADPTTGLLFTLGQEVNKTVAEIREDVIRQARKATTEENRTELAGSIDYFLMEAMVEKGGLSLLSMGRQEGPGCFCPVNDLLREAIETLSQHFDLTIIDGEAGIEQINRRVMRRVDTWAVVTDRSRRGFETARLIRDLIGRMAPSSGAGLVVNRADGTGIGLDHYAPLFSLGVLGCIPEDGELAAFDRQGRPLLELPAASPAVTAVREIMEKLLLKV